MGLTASVADGTVRVRLLADRSAETAWLALTDPARMAMWFGELDQPWLVGRTGRITFGDGDFFEVTAIEIIEGKIIEFEWSFLGVGPLERIRWRVGATPSGAEITVEDHDPDRTRAEIDQMMAGWTDFFERLDRYLRTGEPSRYGWREEIDGSVELPDGGFTPLDPKTLYRWLPVAEDGFEPRWFFIVDADGPRRFRLDYWRLGPDSLTFTVEIPDSLAGTQCEVRVAGRRLRFTHTGWRALGLPDSQCRALRAQFAATWIASLKQAQALAAS